MSKRIASIIVIMLSLAVFVLLLQGCDPDPVEGVRSIELEGGALKEVYRVDEEIDYDNAYLLVTYTGGRVSRVKLTPNMVSGFSTDVPVHSATLTINFAGYKVEWIYRVIGSSEAANSVRLKAEVSREHVLTISLSGTEDFPVLGVMFEVVMSGVAAESDVDGGEIIKVREGVYYSVNHISDAAFRIVIWSKDGRTKFEAGELISFKLIKTGTENGVLTIQKAVVSDGEGDYTVPQSTLEIKQEAAWTN